MYRIFHTILSLKHIALGAVSILCWIWFYSTLSPIPLHTPAGTVLCAILVGIVIALLLYINTRSAERGLLYAPTGQWLDECRAAIRYAGIDPDTISLRYAYTDTTPALVMFKTLVMNPLIWHTDDPHATAVRTIFHTSIEPSLPERTKRMLQRMHGVFNARVQRFIFFHELAHAQSNYSMQVVIRAGLAAVLNTIVALYLYYYLIAQGFYWVAVIGAWLCIVCVDIALGYVTNAVLTYREERAADRFAAQHCMPDDIEAAAQFFEAHGIFYDEGRDTKNVLTALPMRLVSGHPNPKARANYLRTLTHNS